MIYPSRLELRGRGIIHPSELGPTGKLARVARIEPGMEAFGPILAASPHLATTLAAICVAANMRDSAALAIAIHRAESALDALNWDWGKATPIINPCEP